MLVDASTGSSEEPRTWGRSTVVVIAAAVPSELPRAYGWTRQREKQPVFALRETLCDAE